MRKTCEVLLLISILPQGLFAVSERPTVTVEGRHLHEDGYELSVSFDAGQTTQHFDGIVVAAEPGSVPLLVHVKRLDLAEQMTPLTLGEARSLSVGPMKRLSLRTLLPPATVGPDAKSITVKILRDGDEYVVAHGAVDFQSFAVTTRFPLTALDIPTPVGLELPPWMEFSEPGCSTSSYEHCCSGFRCDTNCKCCSGPEFCCSLIECTIECGHDSC